MIVSSYIKIYQIRITIVREKTSNLSYESLTGGVLNIPPQILRAKCVKNKDINIYKKPSLKSKKFKEKEMNFALLKAKNIRKLFKDLVLKF